MRSEFNLSAASLEHRELTLFFLIAIVTGIQLKAELGDRPLAYRIEKEVREHLGDRVFDTVIPPLRNLSPKNFRKWSMK